MKIFFDGYELDRRYVKALSQSAEAFNGTFKLGSTVCRSFDLEISKDCTLLELLQCEDGESLLTEDGLPLRVEQDLDITTYKPQKIRFTDDMEKVYATLRLDELDTEDDYILSYKLTDEMVMLNQEFIYDTSQAHTVQELLNMICTSHGMKLATTSLYLADLQILWGLDGMTERDFVSYVAEVNCGYAFINAEGNLEFGTYTNTPSAEIEVKNCSSFKVGYRHVYDRVYLELASATYYYPEESTNDTLYLNPDNILYTSGGKYPYQDVIKHIQAQLNGFNFYNIEVERCPIPQEALCCETVNFTFNGAIFPTIWQVNYDFNFHWYGGVSCILNNSNQEETKIISDGEKSKRTVNALKITVDRELGLIKQEVQATEEKVNKISSDAVFTVDIMYALSSSNTEAPTTGWSTEAPKPKDGEFIWQKTMTVYGDGSIVESTPTCLQGLNGKDGADGKDGTNGTDGVGISSIEEQYYLSTSKTELLGGSWETTCPSWSKDHYIWSRSKITWTDNTVSYTTPTVSSAINDANEKADNTYQTLITYYSTTEQTDSKIALSVSGMKTDILGEVETTYATKASLEVYVTEDDAKNSIASWINACADNIVLNASSKLVFGDLNNQYITISNYSDSSGNKVGVLFDGTGQIIMTPEGKLDISNYVSGSLYNQFQMQYNSTGKQIYIWNKKYANANNANSISLWSSSSANTSTLINYKMNLITTANQFSMTAQIYDSYTTHRSQLSNFKIYTNYLANSLVLSSNEYTNGNITNSIELTNYKYEGNLNANTLGLSSSNNSDTIYFGNRVSWTQGTSTYTGFLNQINCSVSRTGVYDSIVLTNYAYSTNQEKAGNIIELKATTYDSSGYRMIDIHNRNNDDSSSVSNRIILYKKDTYNYIRLTCTTKDIDAAMIQLDAFEDMVIQTVDRPNHPHNLVIRTMAANTDGSRTFKDGLYINTHQIYFENGYVRYR